MTTKTNLTVRYAETDQMGITHHSVYPIWYEAARTDFIKSMGVSYSEMEQMGIFLPVIEVFSKYISSTTYEDELFILTKINRLTPSKIEFLYEVYKDGANPVLVNTGTTLHPFTNKALKPMNMKKHFLDIYNKIEQYKNIS